MKKFSLTIGGALMLSACATIPGLETYYTNPGASWPTVAVETPELAGQEGRAKLGEFVFVQDTRLMAQAEIAEDTEVFLVNRDGTRGEAVPVLVDNPLGMITGFPPGVVAFCSYRPTFDKRNNVLDQRVFRVCLLDTDRDMVFDRPVFGVVAGQGMGAALMIGQRLPLVVNGHPEIEIPYAVESDDTERFVRVGPVIDRGPLGSYYMSFGIQYEDSVVRLDQGGNHSGRTAAADADTDNAYNVKFKEEDLPITLKVAGASVTITSVSDDEVGYRIDSAYQADAPFLLGFAAEPGLSSDQ